ncbi:unnamed protein product [Microthlaspi erraticum]|uniref:Transposase MuDR plant domain-containing protein n=1 Tax=Microthlaspi erraticum TaxID=1685480 RepID=A0A6D2JSP4_9BRAS|nr:unnamed protein product [Microthlaspi erraticum]
MNRQTTGKGKMTATLDPDEGFGNGNLVVMAGRWIIYWTGVWDFKIDKSRMGRKINVVGLQSIFAFRETVAAAYGVDARPECLELSYWLEDPLAELNGGGSKPGEREGIASELARRRGTSGLICGDKRSVEGVSEIGSTREGLRTRELRGESSGGTGDRRTQVQLTEDEIFLMHVEELEALELRRLRDGPPKCLLQVEGVKEALVVEAETTTVGDKNINNSGAPGRQNIREDGVEHKESEEDEKGKEEGEEEEEGEEDEDDDDEDYEEGDDEPEEEGDDDDGDAAEGYDDVVSDGVDYPWDFWDNFCRQDGKDKNDDDDFVDEPPHFSSRYVKLTQYHESDGDRDIHFSEGLWNKSSRNTTSGDGERVEEVVEEPGVMPQKHTSTERVEGGDEPILVTPPEKTERNVSHGKKSQIPLGGKGVTSEEWDEFVDPPPLRCSGGESGRHDNGGRALMKGMRLVDVYGYKDIEPMFNDMEMTIAKAGDFDLTYEDDAIYVGKMFNYKDHFKITLAIHAIKKMFRFKWHCHAKLYTVGKCIDPLCEWRVMAHTIGDSNRYDVRKANLVHTCDADTRGKFSKHATAKVIAALLRSKYVSSTGPRAKDLPDAVLRSMVSMLLTGSAGKRKSWPSRWHRERKRARISFSQHICKCLSMLIQGQ